MATFTITDCSSDSQLQDFITQASDGDTIIFACSGTVTLTRQLLIKRKGSTTLGLTLDGELDGVIPGEFETVAGAVRVVTPRR